MLWGRMKKARMTTTSGRGKFGNLFPERSRVGNVSSPSTNQEYEIDKLWKRKQQKPQATARINIDQPLLDSPDRLVVSPSARYRFPFWFTP